MIVIGNFLHEKIAYLINIVVTFNIRRKEVKKVTKFMLWIAGFFILIVLFLTSQKIKEMVVSTDSLPLAGEIIVLDPGHGGRDGGAVARDPEKTEEKTITLVVAKMLRHYLEQAGAIVYLTREEDVDLADDDLGKGVSRKSQDIRRRLKFIHDQEADLFLSIHLNSLPSPRWRGAQTFYYPSLPENKQLATFIQEEIILNLENTSRAPLQLNQVYLLKHAKVPGALVELGFLSNEEERELLKQGKYQKKLAISLYRGILRYIETPVSEEDELERM